jgi:hypothetical protein
LERRPDDHCEPAVLLGARSPYKSRACALSIVAAGLLDLGAVEAEAEAAVEE